MIKIRKATIDDANDFSKLTIISAPYFSILFGKRIRKILCDLFKHHSNLFSFKHIYFAEFNGKKAGMILAYDWQTKKRENLMTGFLLFKKMGFSILIKLLSLLKLNDTVGRLYDGEYYISNIAIYPKYRGKGAGKRLMLKAEKEAKIIGAKKIVLDVEKENLNAIKFYEKLGYKIIKDFSIHLQKNKILHFNRMTKYIK